ncbi:MAG: LysR substrate-binding domain-containing protein [Pseudomonadota bacterium]
MLSDPVEPAGPNYGLASARRWRFVDLGRRLDFLLAGFGWCRMPEHLVAAPLADGRLITLEVEAETASTDLLTIYAAHRRDRALGPAGRCLLEDLMQRVRPDVPADP